MANLFQRQINYNDPAAVPPEQAVLDYVVAMDYGDAETAASTLPPSATDVWITSISVLDIDIDVTAAALADLNL